MSADFARAVFLSYASEDAEAARRLCDALRRSGVEVWFDQSELRGGDAWDQKIRRQVRECALFVPLISAHTQARREGYFRLEWKLAEDRTHLMAKGTPFLVPVCIDGTEDGDAVVPDSFTVVQWTRLRLQPVEDGADGEAIASFCERLKTLLASGAGVPRAGVLRAPETFAPPTRPRRQRWLVPAVLGGGVFLALGVWQPWRGGEAAPAAAAAASEARQLAESARRHFQGIFTRADLALAEEFGRRAAEKEPTLALAWAVRAGANACYLMRGFVAGEAAQQRARDAEAFAQRALALHRDETEALIALGQVAMFQKAPSQAEAYYRRVLAREPDNPFAHRYLSIVLRSTGRTAEAIALMQDAARKFPRDTLTRFDLAVAYAYGWDWPRAWEEADAALAIEPFPGALMLKVRLAFQWKGDVALMRDLIEKLDVTYRGEDDAVLWDMRCALWSRQPDRVVEAAGRTARQYLEESFIFPGPKASWTAQAHEMAGRAGLARQQWQVAESVVRDRLNADPQNLELRLKLAVILAATGDERARRELAAIETAWRDQMNPDRAWDLATFYAATGEAAQAVPLLRQALHVGPGIAPLTLHHLKLDPWWDKIRASDEFQALLANPPPLPLPVVMPGQAAAGSTPIPQTKTSKALDLPPDKSIAVLAFANLSDDRENEYFSDGVTEEVINRLARVAALRVSARTSAFHFKGRNTPVPEIARQLGVAYVVQGSVRKSADRVRVTAQLINAADGFHVWSDAVTRELKDIFALQDEIAERIAEALSLKLGVAAQSAATANIPAYELYLKARATLAQRGSANLELARQQFESVLALDPNFIPARAGLARTLSLIPSFQTLPGAATKEHARAAVREAHRVLERDAQNAEAWSVLGTVYTFHEWRWREAGEAMDRALTLAPNDAEVVNFAGDYFRVIRERVRMLATERRALELNPLHAPNHGELADVYNLLGDHDNALQFARQASALSQLVSSHRVLVLSLGALRRFDEMNAALAAARADTQMPRASYLGLAVWAAWLEGRHEQARRLQRELTPHAERSEYSPAHFGYQWLLLGDSAEAAAWLNRAVENRDANLAWSVSIDLRRVAADQKARVIFEKPELRELLELRTRHAHAAKGHR